MAVACIEAARGTHKGAQNQCLHCGYRTILSILVSEPFGLLVQWRCPKRIWFQAKCLHCGNAYAAPPNFGTGTLKWHMTVCSVRNKKSCLSQSLIQFNSDGSVGHWEYSLEVAHTQLCRLIARLDLPLGFGDCEAFEEYIKVTTNPRFATVSANHH